MDEEAVFINPMIDWASQHEIIQHKLTLNYRGAL